VLVASSIWHNTAPPDGLSFPQSWGRFYRVYRFFSNMKFFSMTLSFEDRAARNLKENDLLDLLIQIEKLLQGEKVRSYIALGKELSVGEAEGLFDSINSLLAERRASWVLISPALSQTDLTRFIKRT
jgi:hypothetical protein